MKPNEKTQRVKGVVAVEAALVLPFLILITFSMIYYGWLFFKQQEIANVARHAARYAILPDYVDTDGNPHDRLAEASNLIDTMMSSVGLGTEDGKTYTKSVSYLNAAGVGEPVEVYIEINRNQVELFQLPTLGFGDGFLGPASLKAYMVMSKEGDS